MKHLFLLKQRSLSPCVLYGIALSMVLCCTACQQTRPRRYVSHRPVLNEDFKLLDDHRNYYSAENLKFMGEAFVVGGMMANTGVDEEIGNWYQRDVRSRDTDEAAKVAKQLGEGKYVLPALATAMVAGCLAEDVPIISGLGEWGDRGLRAAAVGAPPLLLMQTATGASRPGEDDSGSRWNPFSDSNGVSGHSFMGAIPFITAAQMSEDPYKKTGFYLASTVAAWSRINDDAHYTSQAFLGWYMAYYACSMVNDTEKSHSNIHFMPVSMQDGMGMGILYRR